MSPSNSLFALGAILSGLFSACGSSAASGAPPKNLHYSTPAAVYARGVEIEANHPSVDGKVTKFWVEPALPVGLSLDGKTGVISGTPVLETDLGHFHVFAQNAHGKTGVSLDIGVALPARFAVVGHAADDTLSVYTIDPATGEWRPRGFRARSSAEQTLRAVVAHPGGESVYVVDETSNDLALYTLDTSTGELAPGGVFATGRNPTAVVFDSAGCHAYVLCKQDETLETYSIDATTGAPTLVGSPLLIDGAPQALRLHPSGKYLYAAATGQSRIQALALDPITHVPSLLGTSRASGQTPVDLEIGPGGRFLYTSNLRGHNLSLFAISDTDGSLTPLTTLATGIFPSDVAIDPTERFLYVCESGADAVHAFAIDASTGELTSLGAAHPAGTRPISLAFESTGAHLYALDIDGFRTWSFPVDPANGQLGTPRELFTRDQPLAITLLQGQNAALPRPRFAYVANAGSQDISVYATDSQNGVLTSITPSVFDHGSPRVVLAAPNGRFVFTLNAITNDAHAFDVADADGELQSTATPAPLSGKPTAGAIDASGRFIFALLGDDDRVDTLEIDAATGALTPRATLTTAAGPAALAVDSTGRFLYVANYTANTIACYRIDPHTGALVQSPIELTVAGEPRSLVCHPDGRHLYAVLETGAAAVKFQIDPYTGELSAPEMQATGALPTSIALDARGRFAYTANHSVTGGLGDLSLYRVDAATGDLTPLGSALTGIGPIALTGDPSGRFLYAVNQDDDTVSIYGIHQMTGLLTIGVSVGTGVAPRSLAIIGTLE